MSVILAENASNFPIIGIRNGQVFEMIDPKMKKNIYIKQGDEFKVKTKNDIVDLGTLDILRLRSDVAGDSYVGHLPLAAVHVSQLGNYPTGKITSHPYTL